MKFVEEILSITENMININMRCIEIRLMTLYCMIYTRLTLTWDVLKWSPNYNPAAIRRGLTLTWDVLKLSKGKEKIWLKKGLTLTWDVLKLIYTVAWISTYRD